MSLSDYIKSNAASYGITGYDIGFALEEVGGIRYFYPSDDDKFDQFTIQSDQGGSTVRLPNVVVKLLLMILDDLAHGEAPVMLPRYQELTIDETADIFNFSKQDLKNLTSQGEIPHRIDEGKIQVTVQDILQYKLKTVASSIDIYIKPEEIISAFLAQPSLGDFIAANEGYFLKRMVNEIGSLKIPKIALRIMSFILSHMTIAHVLVPFPISRDISIEEAAAILHFSKDTTLKLLINNDIHLSKEGYIALKDLMNYKKVLDKERLEGMREITSLWMDDIEIENGEK